MSNKSENKDLEIPEDELSELNDDSSIDEDQTYFPLETLVHYQTLNYQSDQFRDQKKVTMFLEKVQENMNLFTQTFLEISTILLKELRKRPTFQQINQQIGLKIDEQLLDKIQQQVQNKSPTKKDKNDSNKKSLKSGLSLSPIKIGQVQQPQIKTEMVVTNAFVQKLFRQSRKDQKAKYSEMKAHFDEQMVKLLKFVEISDVSFPRVESIAQLAVENATNAQNILEFETFRKLKMHRLREIWVTLKQYKNVQSKKRKSVIGILNNFRKFYMFTVFKKWRKTALILKELSRKDSLKGADIRLQTFQQQIIDIDKAIQFIHQEKPSWNDFENLKQQFSEINIQNVFNDMKNLFDFTSQNLRDEINQIRVRQNFNQVQPDFAQEQNIKSIYLYEFQKIGDRIYKIEDSIRAIELEQGKLNSSFGAQISKVFAINDKIQKLVNMSEFKIQDRSQTPTSGSQLQRKTLLIKNGFQQTELDLTDSQYQVKPTEIYVLKQQMTAVKTSLELIRQNIQELQSKFNEFKKNKQSVKSNKNQEISQTANEKTVSPIEIEQVQKSVILSKQQQDSLVHEITSNNDQTYNNDHTPKSNFKSKASSIQLGQASMIQHDQDTSNRMVSDDFKFNEISQIQNILIKDGQDIIQHYQNLDLSNQTMLPVQNLQNHKATRPKTSGSLLSTVGSNNPNLSKWELHLLRKQNMDQGILSPQSFQTSNKIIKIEYGQKQHQFSQIKQFYATNAVDRYKKSLKGQKTQGVDLKKPFNMNNQVSEQFEQINAPIIGKNVSLSMLKNSKRQNVAKDSLNNRAFQQFQIDIISKNFDSFQDHKSIVFNSRKNQ